MEPLLYFAGIFIFLKVAQIAATANNLRNIRFKYGDSNVIEVDTVPEHIRHFFEQQAKQITNLGFNFSHCQLADEPVSSDYSKVYEFIYFHPEHNSYANLVQHEAPDKISPIKYEFSTILDDNSIITTLNGILHCSFNTPNVQYYDHYVDSVEKQFQLHIKNVSANIGSRKTTVLLPEDYAKLEKHQMAKYIDQSIANGELKPAHEENTYKMSFIFSLRFASKMISGMPKSTKRHNAVKAQAKKQNIVLQDVPVELEVEAFQKNKQITEAKKGGFVPNLIIFIISMLAFMISFRVSLSLAIILQMVVVLFIHELGHYIAMYIFKYQDLKVMFIPFLGAATIGQGHNKTSALQKVIVYLMGPAPGIIIATVLLIFFQDKAPFIREFAIMMLTLNYINLLPILPLDGGRLFELALFSKYRFLKTGFIAISILLLAAGAVVANTPILWFLPIALLVNLISQMKNGKIISEINKQVENENLENSDNVLLPRIFKALQKEPFSEMKYTQKSGIVKNILAAIAIKKVSLGESILALILYGAVFISPFVIIIIAGFTMGLSGIYSNNSSGVYSISPSPNKEMFIVNGSHNAFSQYNYILDREGNKIMDLDRNAVFNNYLCWSPNPDSKFIAFSYPKKGNLFSSESSAITREPLVLLDMETSKQITITNNAISQDCGFNYKYWDKQGNYLLGITFEKETPWQIKDLFRHEIASNTINSIDISELNCTTYADMNFTDRDKVILTVDQDDYDSISMEFASVNIGTKEIKRYKYEDAIQCKLSNDGKTVYLLDKIFENNIVKYQIAKSELDDSNRSETVIIDSSHFPQFSFEDAARGKELDIYFELSPKENWLWFELDNSEEKTATHIFNLKNEANCILCEQNSNYYSNLYFSDTEDKILFNCYTFDYDDTENNEDLVYLFDMKQEPPVRTILSESLAKCDSFEFINNSQILHIKDIPGETEKDTTRELWLYDIETEVNEPFEN